MQRIIHCYSFIWTKWDTLSLTTLWFLSLCNISCFLKLRNSRHFKFACSLYLWSLISIKSKTLSCCISLFWQIVVITFFLLFLLTSFKNRWSVFRIYKWMEYAHFAFNLKLHKRIQEAFLYFLTYKGLSHIKPIFIEADDPSININQHANNSSHLKVSKLWLLMAIQLIVIFPFPICKLVSSCEIQAPHMLLPAKILVNHKIFFA